MPVVKAIVLSTRRKLKVRTGGGTTITYKLIEHVKVGDEVWVFVSKYGEIQKIEPHSCKHAEHAPQGKVEILEPPINYSELDSVE